jgi:cobalt-precorrin 5A hydrolase / precorrin-3B C17-methyltransferase
VILLRHRDPKTPVLIARNLGREGETCRVSTLSALAEAEIDMLTIVIVGSRETRLTQTDPPRLYTPRGYAGR